MTPTPVLQGNTSAVNTVTGKKTTLNLTDPDSLMVDNKGDVVLDSQADSEIITVRPLIRPYALIYLENTMRFSRYAAQAPRTWSMTVPAVGRSTGSPRQAMCWSGRTRRSGAP